MRKRAVIIQARNNSSRFPNKMLSDIDGKGTPVFTFLLQRILSKLEANVLFLATTQHSCDDMLCHIAETYGVSVFRGDENNVLKRFIDCATTYGISEIIRLCADNPFIFLPDLLHLNTLAMRDTDYVAFNVDNKPSIITHYGFWAELVTLKTLQKVADKTTDRLYLEHVTNYIYQHGSNFRLHFIDSKIPPSCLDSNMRLTLDTEQDLQNIRYIIQEVNKPPAQISLEDIYGVIAKQPNLLREMSMQIEKNTK